MRLSVVVFSCCVLVVSASMERMDFSKPRSAQNDGSTALLQSTPDSANLHYSAAVVPLDATNWRREVAKENNGLFVVEFYAPWCPHCQHMAPVYSACADWFSKQATKDKVISFGAVNCVKSRTLCDKYKIRAYPTLFSFRRGVDPEPKEIPRSPPVLDKLIEVVKKRVEDEGLTKPGQWTAMPDPAPEHPADATKPKPAAPAASPQLADLATAVLQGIHRGTFVGTGHLMGERKAALEAWLGLLSSRLPTATQGAPLAAFAAALKAKPSWSRAAFDTALSQVRLYRIHLAESKWVGCKGSPSPYACGLWLLFHTMTAHSPDAGAKATLMGIGEYVSHFFPCQQCQEHFAKHSAELPSLTLDTTKEAALWLWKVHNAVTARVHPTRVAWPTAQECASCHGMTKGDSSGGEMAASPDGGWDEEALSRFLRRVYNADTTNGDKERGQAGGEEGEGKDGAALAGAPSSPAAARPDSIVPEV